MALSTASVYLKKVLLSKGWKPTRYNNIITKNNCALHLDTDKISTFSEDSYIYTMEEIAQIEHNDYNIQSSNLTKNTRVPALLIKLNGVHYFIEKYGWLLLSGKYDSNFNYVANNSTSSDIPEKIINAHNEFISKIEDVADRDYSTLRGIKQYLYQGTKKENIMSPKVINAPISEGSFMTIIKDSDKCSVFKAGSVFKIQVILDEAVYITAVNTKGVITNKNYEIAPDIFLEEAVEGNIKIAELEPTTIDVPYESWVDFMKGDLVTKLPENLNNLISSEKLKRIVQKLYSDNKNYSILLNPKISENAYDNVVALIDNNYCSDALYSCRIREDNALIWLRYVLLGYNPERFIDDSVDAITLEEELQVFYNEVLQYQQALINTGLNSDTAKVMGEYYFQFGSKMEVQISDTTRWQFLIPYFFKKELQSDAMIKISNIIKTYGVLTAIGCIIKGAFLDAEIKALILKYFKIPVQFYMSDVDWDTFVFNLLDDNAKIIFTKDSISIRKTAGSLKRDINSVYIVDSGNIPVWRCTFINEEAICSGNADIIYM